MINLGRRLLSEKLEQGHAASALRHSRLGSEGILESWRKMGLSEGEKHTDTDGQYVLTVHEAGVMSFSLLRSSI